jgi:hypothetical protein
LKSRKDQEEPEEIEINEPVYVEYPKFEDNDEG